MESLKKLKSFILPAAGPSTPESIKRKRQMAEAMMASGADVSPIASPWQGAARMAHALVGGYSAGKADKQEAEGTASAREAMIKALNGGDNTAVMEAATNPFADSNSMAFLGKRWDQLNPAAPDPFTLGQGDLRFDGSGKEIARGLPKTPEFTINNVPAESPMMGTIPPGYAAVKDPESPSGFRLMPIGGGPEDTSAVDAARTSKQLTLTDTVVGAASNARKLISRASTGLIGQGLSYFGETDAAEINRQTEVLKSNAKIENLNAMRRESKTGGALGAVTQNETEMLASAAGALDPKAGPVRYKAALDNYELTLLRIVHGYEAGNQIFQQTRSQEAQPVPEPVAPQGGAEEEYDAQGNRVN